ncbi:MULTISPECIES: hypothetical protein [Mycobacteriaceae]|uniref:hypothetical protein n=1 Tax=Mycobacteriaceae TaxID=1762 RepID=UPI0007FD1F9C|nr:MULTISPECIES: hypothetical protein [Mycobacteriaceae]MCK0175758.1 hypothetical protein [Mycolicibacterium sp. F2034L]OBB60157.1 hypothetical protein A5757_10845 [Mycobacterium sp. 852013-51886_SCH5428379]
MSSDDQEQSGAERNASTNVADDPDAKITEKPEVTDEHREAAKEMRKEYEEERPTIVMPGTGGTVAGTAVNEWVDENGDPKFGKDGEEADPDSSDSSANDAQAAQAQN